MTDDNLFQLVIVNGFKAGLDEKIILNGWHFRTVDFVFHIKEEQKETLVY